MHQPFLMYSQQQEVNNHEAFKFQNFGVSYGFSCVLFDWKNDYFMPQRIEPTQSQRIPICTLSLELQLRFMP